MTFISWSTTRGI